MQILIGRVIVVLVGLIAYSLLASVPVLAVIMPLLFLAVLPVLLVRSMRFNAAMSSWANARFGGLAGPRPIPRRPTRSRSCAP